MNCLYCNTTLVKDQKKYCDQQCQSDHYRQIRIKDWLDGNIMGMRGKTSTAEWIKKYLIDIHGEKCMKCDWATRNQFTNKIPIELNHIDGDFRNNIIENLELLCPNCHSLTSSYKGANKKQGRPRNKYYRGT